MSEAHLITSDELVAKVAAGHTLPRDAPWIEIWITLDLRLPEILCMLEEFDFPQVLNGNEADREQVRLRVQNLIREKHRDVPLILISVNPVVTTFAFGPCVATTVKKEIIREAMEFNRGVFPVSKQARSTERFWTSSGVFSLGPV
jgi:hypothetical protein